MPATVSTSHIPNAELAERLCVGVTERFKAHPTELRINIVGGQSNENWQLKMATPDGSKKRNHNLKEQDRYDGHELAVVLATLEKMAAEMEASQT